MIINKEILSKIHTISLKMENVGFGELKKLEKELIQRYIDLQGQEYIKNL